MLVACVDQCGETMSDSSKLDSIFNKTICCFVCDYQMLYCMWDVCKLKHMQGNVIVFLINVLIVLLIFLKYDLNGL